MKNCDNCDHREVCIDVKRGLSMVPGLDICDEWQGWIPTTDEEPPKNTPVLIAIDDGSVSESLYEDNTIVFLHFGNVTVHSVHLDKSKVVAWRRMPEHEGSKE